MYSPDDMQLFHHYLTAAYPCIPSNNEQVWTRHIPLKTYQVVTFCTQCRRQAFTVADWLSILTS